MLRQEFLHHANADDAIGMKRYIKGKFEYHGLKSPIRKELSKPFLQTWAKEHALDPRKLAMELWMEPEREYQYVAMEFLALGKKYWQEHRIALYEDLIRTKSWWDTVDHISSTLVGGILKKYPENKPLMGVWNKESDMWIQRCSIIFQLKYGKEMDLDVLSKHIRRHKSSKEFFIQKAIGWSLRQAARFYPDWVLEFVGAHELPALSKREALKHFK